MKYGQRLLGLLLLGGLLAGCASEIQVPALETQSFMLSGIRWVSSSKKTFNPPHTNPGDYTCVTTEFDLPPQGFRVRGSTGGLGYRADAPNTPASVVGGALQRSFLSSFSITPQSTELLIVDDFGAWNAPQYTLPSDLFAPNADNATLETLMGDGKLTHGALVLRHAKDVLAGTGLYAPSDQTPDGMQTVYKRGSSLLKVTAVNTRLQNQEVIAGTTKVKITTGDLYEVLKTPLVNGPKVVNLSFVLTSCEVYEDFVRSGLPTLESYLEQLARVNNITTNLNGVLDLNGELDLMRRVVESTNITNDPLLELIKVNAKHHVFVAASGNYGLPYAMYPARWPGVVNVTGSAVEAPDQRATKFFNAGEVMSIGTLFRLNPPTHSGVPVFYSGTSYAAPSVSVFSALDLALKGRCTDSQTFKSELALDTVSLVDVRLETSSSGFVTTPGAVQRRCGSN
jgi:hypothetical protein